MYAVVTTGGKQYRVEAGSTLVVEKLIGEPGSSVTFDRVLLIGDGESVTVGTPTVAGASVRATVLGDQLGAKIVVFKFKQKVKYRRRTGHRQHLTRLHIDAISADGKTVTAEEPAKKPAKAAAKRASKATAKRKVTASAPAATEVSAPAKKAPAKAAAAPKVAKTSAGEATEAKPVRTRAARAAKAKASAPSEEKPKPRRASRAKAAPAKEE